MKDIEDYKTLKKYNKELHEKAYAIGNKVMYDGMLLQSKGRMLDVTWCESTLQGLQVIIPYKIPHLNKATMGLGAGYSFTGEICGHVSAGVIAIGLDVLSKAEEEGKDTVLMRTKIQNATRFFIRSFREKFGSASCRDLTHSQDKDLSDPLQFAEAFDKGGFDKCWPIQRWVAMFPLPSEQDSKITPSLEQIQAKLGGQLPSDEAGLWVIENR